MKVNGALFEHQGVRVLHVWGTYYEMGYAQGRILAPEVVRIARDLAHSVHTCVVGSDLIVPNAIRAEAEGLAAGVNEVCKTKAVLGRKLTANDILLANLYSEAVGIGCSSVSVWGKRSATGKTILARNLDYGRVCSDDVVIARSPRNKRRWVSCAWPAALGCYTGWTETHAAMVHDAWVNAESPKRFISRQVVLQCALIQAKADSGWMWDTARLFAAAPTVRASSMHIAGENNAVVYEYDSDTENGHGVSVRFPEKRGDQWLACTNTLRLRGLLSSECGRYAKLKSCVANNKADAALMWDAITSVGNCITLQTVLVDFGNNSMWVALADDTTPAHQHTPAVFHWSNFWRTDHHDTLVHTVDKPRRTLAQMFSSCSDEWLKKFADDPDARLF